MLDFAKKYEDDLKLEFSKISDDIRFMWFDNSTYRDVYEASKSTWSTVEYVSLDAGGKIIGYLKYRIDRELQKAYAVQIINFKTFEEKSHKITFGKDVDEFFRNVFEKYNHNKIVCGVVIGNPIEPTYDKLITKFGGRIVGMYTDECKLLDGRLYDYKVYEINKKDYKRR